MPFDRDRIRTILNAKHSYYDLRNAIIRVDARLHPGSSDFLAAQISPTMHVLDIGCGSGETLLDLSEGFLTGIGIDCDPEHIKIAQETKRVRAIQNVEFLLLDFPREIGQLHPELFDIVFSQRGPMCDTASGVQAALRLLRPDGLIFCEEIGDLHLPEVAELFGSHHRSCQMVRKGEVIRAAMERCRVSIRLVSDIVTKWYYPDIYEWLFWQCSIWTWLGIPLPEPDDPQIDLFAERNTAATGEIETTHHIVLVAGVKQRS